MPGHALEPRPTGRRDRPQRGGDRRREELEAQRANLQQNPPSPELKKELEALEQELSQVELTLESELFSWDGLREIFWQAVRFGGLGVVLGWFFRVIGWCVGGFVGGVWKVFGRFCRGCLEGVWEVL